MAPSSAASPAAPAAPARPRVGLLYTHASALSREGEYLAKYVGLALASTGAASKVAVVGVDVNATSSATKAEDETVIIRADGVVYRRSQAAASGAYDETTDVRTLRDCHVWILCLDSASTSNAVQYIQKRVASGDKSDTSTPKRRVIVCLQPAMRQLRELENSFPTDTVLHGGACFHLAKNKHGVLYPLSHGCYFVERLASDKTHALFALDLLEATGFQLLSRKNIQALKWGHSMLRLFYFLNALTGEPVAASLRDRAMRLVFLELLHEMDALFTVVAADFNGAKDTVASWAPDTSGCSYLSIHATMVLLPLPNWIFNNVVLRLVDLGLAASDAGVSTVARDVAARRETEFWTEFKDVFDLAKRRSIELPALATLRNTLQTLTQQGWQESGGLQPTISGRGLLSQIQSTPPSRAVSRRFFVKVVVTLVATLLLVLFVLM